MSLSWLESFATEGVDSTHNPEFTLLKTYQAFADYNDMIDLTERLIVAAAKDSIGSDRVEIRWSNVNSTDLGDALPSST